MRRGQFIRLCLIGKLQREEGRGHLRTRMRNLENDHEVLINRFGAVFRSLAGVNENVNLEKRWVNLIQLSNHYSNRTHLNNLPIQLIIGVTQQYIFRWFRQPSSKIKTFQHNKGQLFKPLSK